jgi:hypothetical protein
MRCLALAAQVRLRLKGILRCAVHRAGIASAIKPPLHHPPGLTAGSGTAPDGSATSAEASEDIFMVLPQGISIAEASVVQPLSINTLSLAATTEGAAAPAQDQQKQRASARVEPNGDGFAPCSMESYGSLGLPAMKLLHELGDEAAGPGGVSRA